MISSKPNSPTLRDVARLAGVSHQTVSRVINGIAPVSTDTRNRVLDAINNLGYQPNAIARSMARGRSFTLACLSPSFTDFTFSSIIEGAESEARSNGYFVMSSTVENTEEYFSRLNELVASRRTEGLLIITTFFKQEFLHNLGKFPAVVVGAAADQSDVDYIALDNKQGAFTAVSHLIELGHKNIAMVTGPTDEDCTYERSSGFTSCIHGAGFEIKPTIIEGDWSATSGYQAFLKIHETQNHPTAIFAQNDRMAIGVIRAARDLGFSVPDDISVVGFDDMPLASYFDPPLTTIRQDTKQIGCLAARLLISRIENPEVSFQHLRIPAGLVVRKSTTSRR